MSYVMAGGMGLSAAGGIASGIMGSSAARKQVEEMRKAIAYQKEKDAQNTANFQPYLNFGKGQIGGLESLTSSLGQSPDQYMDPGYKFRSEQGMKGLLSNAATAGMLKSGDTLRAAQDYGQGLASQEYGNAFNRRLQEGQFRQQNVGMGMGAVGNLGSLNNQGAANVGALTGATDFGGSDRALGNMFGGLGGMMGGGLAGMGGKSAGMGGSNIFGKRG